MKAIGIAFAAILATTSASWSAPAPITLTHSQLVEIVQRADGDPRTTRGFIGAHLVLDLRPSTKYPYFVAAGGIHDMAFICQVGFETFAGGPVTATLVQYERGEDARDYVKLNGCNPLER